MATIIVYLCTRKSLLQHYRESVRVINILYPYWISWRPAAGHCPSTLPCEIQRMIVFGGGGRLHQPLHGNTTHWAVLGRRDIKMGRERVWRRRESWVSTGPYETQKNSTGDKHRANCQYHHPSYESCLSIVWSLTLRRIISGNGWSIRRTCAQLCPDSCVCLLDVFTHYLAHSPCSRRVTASVEASPTVVWIVTTYLRSAEKIFPLRVSSLGKGILYLWL